MRAPSRVLLVEDNVTFGDTLRAAIIARGHTCAVVRTASAAIEAVEMNTFDAIVSDLHIGNDNGMDLLRQIMSLDPKPTRILMSGSAPESVKLALGVVHRHLMKPVDLDVLLDGIERTGQTE